MEAATNQTVRLYDCLANEYTQIDVKILKNQRKGPIIESTLYPIVTKIEVKIPKSGSLYGI